MIQHAHYFVGRFDWDASVMRRATHFTFLPFFCSYFAFRPRSPSASRRRVLVVRLRVMPLLSSCKQTKLPSILWCCYSRPVAAARRQTLHVKTWSHLISLVRLTHKLATFTTEHDARSSLSPLFMEEASSLAGVQMTTNKYELLRHGRGESYHESRPPLAVLLPDSTEAIVGIVNLCRKHQIPIIPYGAGTSLEGHVAALHGGISLDTSRLDDIELPLDGALQDSHVTVGAGVTRNRLNNALRHTGE